MPKRNNTLIIIIAIVILLLFGNTLLSLFTPRQDGLKQYVVDAEDVAELDRLWLNRFDKGTLIGNTRTDFQERIMLNTFFSDTVEINSGKNMFKFISSKSDNGARCIQSIDVFKNNQLVDTINSENRIVQKYYDDETQSSYIELRMLEGAFKPGAGCLGWENLYKIKFSDNAFNIDASTETTTFIEGQNITVFVDIENTLNEEVSANVRTRFRVDTVIGIIERIESQEVTLNPGDNRLEYVLPATAPEGDLNIQVDADIEYRGDNLQGLNFRTDSIDRFTQCFNTRGDGSCEEARVYTEGGSPARIEMSELVPLGIVESEDFSISISPRPLYLPLETGECPSGYIKNEEGTFCIREDVAELSCFVLGCPTLEGVQYECTSAGICAETVFIPLGCQYDEETFSELTEEQKGEVDTNTICPRGTTCDAETGFCIESEIFENLIQCEIDSDCPTPCEGKTASCNELNRCGYIGECEVQEFGCRELGCTEDFVCNQNKNVCEKQPLLSFETLMSILVTIGLIVVLVLILRKRRRKRR